MNNRKKSKQKSKEDHLLEVLEDLEKDLNCSKITLEIKDNQRSRYNKILKAAKIEYQKLFNKNKSLIEENKKFKQQKEQQQQQQQRGQSKK